MNICVVWVFVPVLIPAACQARTECSDFESISRKTGESCRRDQ